MYKVILSLSVCALVWTCVYGASAAEGPKSCPVKSGEGDYSYDPLSGKGPDDWGKIKGYGKCKNGKKQSPIDFPPKGRYAPLARAPKPNMKPSKMSLGAGAENWALNCIKPGTCGSTTFRGRKYNVVNIHMHTPSEHTLNGTQYPLEAHIVHATADGKLAVIATMFDYPDEHAYSSAIYRGKPIEYGTNALIEQIMNGVNKGFKSINVNLGTIMRRNAGYCSYVGSLTTPPCSEGVTFFMQLAIQPVSRQQVNAYHISAGGSMYGNNRPIQKINGRKLLCYV